MGEQTGQKADWRNGANGPRWSEKAPSGSSQRESVTPEEQDVPSQVAVNLTELLVRVDNDSDLLRELIEIFKEEYPRILQELRWHVSRKDMKSVEASSHALKGMVSGLSAMRAAAAAAHLENMGREGNTVGLTDALLRFENEVDTLLPELDKCATGVKT